MIKKNVYIFFNIINDFKMVLKRCGLASLKIHFSSSGLGVVTRDVRK